MATHDGERIAPGHEKEVGPALGEEVAPGHQKEYNGFGDDVESVSLPDSTKKGDVLGLEHTDPVLNAKMYLVNNAIDEIGFTWWQGKLFCLNGFGYAVDSLILLIQSIIATPAGNEFRPGYPKGLTIAVYVGMLVGALFWGLSADIIGRKFAFNFSLIISSIFCIVAGAAPNWIVLGLFVCLSAFGSGGNLVLDTAVFLEYLPSKQQWLLTTMAAWWGLGQMVAGLFAWAYLPNFSCPQRATCTYTKGVGWTDCEGCDYGNNKGWRYIWYTCGALVFVMSMLRITVIRLRETPKFLLGEGKDEEVIETLQFIANKYNRPCSLTLEQLSACGITGQGGRRASLSHATSKWSPVEIWVHLKGLYVTKRIGLSTTLIWWSWLLIGLAYPLYNVFLPTYLATRGAQTGSNSDYTEWRNYTLANFSSIWGPFLAGWMCSQKIFWGRRGTMIIGALITMVFFFAYTQVRTPAQNVGFSCAISFCLNIYYGTLYAYTPEVLPSAHRGTGNGIAIGINRIMGIMSAVIATYADTSTPVPIYICAALYAVMAITAAVFPFEPMGQRSS